MSAGIEHRTRERASVAQRPRMHILARQAVMLAILIAAPAAAFSQGRCIRAYGTPACNTDPVPPFESTGWRTTSLDHITFRVADPQKEAAFYAALMGWTVRADDGKQVVMDAGDGAASSSGRSRPIRSASGSTRGAVAVRAVVEGFGFAIEPWDAKPSKPNSESAGSIRSPTTMARASRAFT